MRREKITFVEAIFVSIIIISAVLVISYALLRGTIITKYVDCFFGYESNGCGEVLQLEELPNIGIP